jgi:glycosyltransferase involved in cell wall biosynthesis
MKISFCTTLKNRSKIQYDKSDLTLNEIAGLLNIERTLQVVKHENINNPNFSTNYDILKKPSELFQDFVKSILEVIQYSKLSKYDYELVVVDWCSTDVNIKEYLETTLQNTTLQWKLHSHPEAGFSRGKGLNLAANVATGDILFFIDTDMVFTGDQILVECIEAAKNDYLVWPVCYKASDFTRLHLTAEWAGYGNCMMTKTNFKKYGPWEEIKRWGGEDTHFYQKVFKNAKIHRKLFSSFIHQWHSEHLRVREQIPTKS